MSLQSMGISNSAYINIQQAVTIQIGHGYTATPIGSSSNTCFVCNIFKFKIAFVEVEFVVAFAVCRKINIGQTIIIDITRCNTPTVIIIEIIKYVKEFLFFELVRKGDVCF